MIHDAKVMLSSIKKELLCGQLFLKNRVEFL